LSVARHRPLSVVHSRRRREHPADGSAEVWGRAGSLELPALRGCADRVGVESRSGLPVLQGCESHSTQHGPHVEFTTEKKTCDRLGAKAVSVKASKRLGRCRNPTSEAIFLPVANTLIFSAKPADSLPSAGRPLSTTSGERTTGFAGAAQRSGSIAGCSRTAIAGIRRSETMRDARYWVRTPLALQWVGFRRGQDDRFACVRGVLPRHRAANCGGPESAQVHATGGQHRRQTLAA